jgi:hypothetical protein
MGVGGGEKRLQREHVIFRKKAKLHDQRDVADRGRINGINGSELQT